MWKMALLKLCERILLLKTEMRATLRTYLSFAFNKQYKSLCSVFWSGWWFNVEICHEVKRCSILFLYSFIEVSIPALNSIHFMLCVPGELYGVEWSVLILSVVLTSILVERIMPYIIRIVIWCTYTIWIWASFNRLEHSAALNGGQNPAEKRLIQLI
jgi:hypothetical protein